MNLAAYRAFCKAVARDIAAEIKPELLAQIQAQVPSNKVLSIANAAVYLGVSDSTVRKLIKSGELQTVPGIKNKRILQSVLDAFGKAAK